MGTWKHHWEHPTPPAILLHITKKEGPQNDEMCGVWTENIPPRLTSSPMGMDGLWTGNIFSLNSWPMVNHINYLCINHPEYPYLCCSHQVLHLVTLHSFYKAWPLTGSGIVAHKYIPYLFTYDTLPTYYRVVWGLNGRVCGMVTKVKPR
jgi:hypothetical protein